MLGSGTLNSPSSSLGALEAVLLAAAVVVAAAGAAVVVAAAVAAVVVSRKSPTLKEEGLEKLILNWYGERYCGRVRYTVVWG